MICPIRADWFRRVKCAGKEGVCPVFWGFVVRFPGRTPKDAHAWLKAHGYVFAGREWCRRDRKPSSLSSDGHWAHRRVVTERRRRRRLRIANLSNFGIAP